MMKTVLLLALGSSPVAARPLTSAERTKAEAIVVSTLTDPDSARFQWRDYDPSSGMICGRVNAKNKFGGYVGFKTVGITVIDGVDGKPALGAATIESDIAGVTMPVMGC